MDIKELAKHYLTIAAGTFIVVNGRFLLEPERITLRHIVVGMIDYFVLFGFGLLLLWMAAKQKEPRR
jgi:hypothetical protein